MYRAMFLVVLVAILCVPTKGDGAPNRTKPIEGTWKIIFFGQQYANLHESDKGDALVVDVEMTLTIADDTLTIKSSEGPFAWKVEKLEIREGKTGEIDLSRPDEDKKAQNGIIKLDKDMLYIRLPFVAGRDRPKEFTIKANKDGILIAAKKVKD